MRTSKVVKWQEAAAAFKLSVVRFVLSRVICRFRWKGYFNLEYTSNKRKKISIKPRRILYLQPFINQIGCIKYILLSAYGKSIGRHMCAEGRER